MIHVTAHIYSILKGLQKHEWIVEEERLPAVEDTIAYMLDGNIPKTLVFKETKEHVPPKGKQ